MHEEKQVVFKTVLYVDDKVVAQSEDLGLWQTILSSINAGTEVRADLSPLNGGKEVPNLDGDDNLVKKFSEELGINYDLIADTCSPMIESPFISLDMKSWEKFKRNCSGKRSIPDVVVVGTILALWKKHAHLEEATHKEVIKILKPLNITPTNPTRSYKNCEWLKFESGKVMLLASKYSKAQEMMIEYCNSIM